MRSLIEGGKRLFESKANKRKRIKKEGNERKESQQKIKEKNAVERAKALFKSISFPKGNRKKKILCSHIIHEPIYSICGPKFAETFYELVTTNSQYSVIFYNQQTDADIFEDSMVRFEVFLVRKDYVAEFFSSSTHDVRLSTGKWLPSYENSYSQGWF